MKLGTIAGGVGTTTTISIQHVPQFLSWVGATTLTALRVSVLGDGVILDLDANGLDALKAVRMFGQVANGFIIPLANGIVKNKTVEIVATNAAVGAIDIYGISRRDNANVYFQSLKATVLASSGETFRKFAYLGLPSLAPTDILTVEFADGLVQKFDQPEVLASLQLSQNVVGTYGIDNFDGKIKRVMLTPVANEIVHVMRFVPVGNVSQTIE